MRAPRKPMWVFACLTALACLVLSLMQFAGPLQVARAQQAAVQAQQPGCLELVTNGNFETDQGWVAGADPIVAQYVSNQYHSPQRSMQLGIPPGSSAQAGNSSIREQYLITIPNSAGRATLSFWYLAFMPTTPTTDYIEMNLLGPDGRPLLAAPWRAFVPNEPGWTQAIFDLSYWRGLTIQLYFNVFNDGVQTATLYLDDVSLLTCAGGTAIPTPYYSPWPTPGTLPTATTYYLPTPSPLGPAPIYTPTGTLPPPPPQSAPPAANCTDVVQNSNFAQGFAGWYVPGDRIMPQVLYVPGGAYAQLGTWQNNLDSYSSIRQSVSIPAAYGQIWLDFSTWTWIPTPPGNDRQEADFLAPNQQVLQKFWRVQTNDRQWTRQLIPIAAYAGQNVLLYFNVYNDGASGVAGMYLDEVHIWVCGAGAMSAGPAPFSPQPLQALAEIQGAAPAPVQGTFMPTPGAAQTTPFQSQGFLPTPTPEAGAALPAGAANEPVGTVLPPPGTAAAALSQAGPVPTVTGQATPTRVPEAMEEQTESAAATGTAGAAPLDTVLVARGTPPPPVTATGLARTPTAPPAATPQGLFSRLGQALRLPQGWPWGLLAILALLALFIWALRQR